MTDKTSKRPTENSLRNVYAALAAIHDKLAEDDSDDLARAHRRRVAKRLRELAAKEPPPDHASALSSSKLKCEIGTRLEIVIDESDDPQGAMDELAGAAERRGLIDSSNLPRRESPQEFILDLWTDNPLTLERLHARDPKLPDPLKINDMPSALDAIP